MVTGNGIQGISIKLDFAKRRDFFFSIINVKKSSRMGINTGRLLNSEVERRRNCPVMAFIFSIKTKKSKTAVPNLFSARDRFPRRQFFHG